MLIVLRHGRTASNASRRLLGRMDVPLDELGRRQAEALGQSQLVRAGHPGGEQPAATGS